MPSRARRIRSQFSHVVDIAPTILEAASLPEPTSVNGTVQEPMAGTSLMFSLNDADAPERHTVQYFEMFGNRALNRTGGLQVLHRAPWQTGKQKPLQDDVWSCTTPGKTSAWSTTWQTVPERVAAMEAKFMEEAEKYNVLPIDDRSVERVNPAIAGRPDLLGGRKSLTLMTA